MSCEKCADLKDRLEILEGQFNSLDEEVAVTDMRLEELEYYIYKLKELFGEGEASEYMG